MNECIGRNRTFKFIIVVYSIGTYFIVVIPHILVTSNHITQKPFQHQIYKYLSSTSWKVVDYFCYFVIIFKIGIFYNMNLGLWIGRTDIAGYLINMSFLNGPIIIKFSFYEPNRRFIFKLIVGNCWIFQIYVILGYRFTRKDVYLLMEIRSDLNADIWSHTLIKMEFFFEMWTPETEWNISTDETYHQLTLF